MEADIYTERPRIVLVSGGFSNELTTSVLWLNDNYGLDIRCIRLQPYRNGNELLVETSQVIPLPEAKDYQTQFRKRENEVRRQRSSQSRSVPGGQGFEESIESAPEQFQPQLKRLYDWAVGLEQEGLAELETGFVQTQTCLWPLVFDVNGRNGKTRLLKVIRDSDAPRIWLLKSVLSRLAPNTTLKVEGLMATQHPGKISQVIGPSEEMLSLLTNAYREANGLETVTNVAED